MVGSSSNRGHRVVPLAEMDLYTGMFRLAPTARSIPIGPACRYIENLTVKIQARGS